MQHLALTTALCFYKSDYFPSAFNKKKALVSDSGSKQLALLTEVGNFSTGWNCSPIGNRRSGDKGGGAEGGGQAEQEIAPELRLSGGKGSWRPGAPPPKVAQTLE